MECHAPVKIPTAEFYINGTLLVKEFGILKSNTVGGHKDIDHKLNAKRGKNPKINGDQKM